MRLLLLSLLFLGLNFPSDAQLSTEGGHDSLPSWQIGARAHYGFIMPHRRGMRHLVKGHVPSFALILEKPTNGSKPWERLYDHPLWGITLMYTDLNNPEMLGKAAMILPYIDFPLWKAEKGGLYFRTGTGAGWIEKPFDRLENSKNIAIGSQGNITFSFMLHGRFGLPGRWSGSMGLSLEHFSNMAVRRPNLGINVPSVHFGLMRGFGQQASGPSEAIPTPEFPERSEYRYSLSAGFGVKGVPPPDGDLFPAYSFMGEAMKKLSGKTDIGLGSDLEWNSGIPARIEEELDGDGEVRSSDALRVGLKATYTLVIDRLRLLAQWGFYVHDRFEEDGVFYHRFGLRYDLGAHWTLNGTLKTHFAKADHFELGLGYIIGGR